MKVRRRFFVVLMVLCLCIGMLSVSALGLDNNQNQLDGQGYNITYRLTGVQGENELPQFVAEGNDLALQFVALEGYKLPATDIIVKIGEIEQNQRKLINS